MPHTHHNILFIIFLYLSIYLYLSIFISIYLSTAQNRVLVRGSSIIEKAGLINVVALDKTGTLTKGFFKVTDTLILPICHLKGYNPLELAAAIEQKSSHPLANAIVSAFIPCTFNFC